ncbi:UNVERIFIED_ORG: ABC-type nitrate/sulfonate/bicarbonate transport system ATPase subunit [Rhizobium aethiopicum]|uniref:ATP-binding cassette domain-containing protein n=1 Tax=Rhizobium TaxID=379 RepID=UPI0006732F71|nr:MULTISPECIES: ATP-binding cassette domain-containing protein [Rhizobium]OHV26135.1 hypothetical protein BBJ66_05275 [Rhizobium sp. RSm-3]
MMNSHQRLVRSETGRIVAEQVPIRLGKGKAAFETVSDVSFTVAPGEFVCLLGPSGCGKSTLFGALDALTRLKMQGLLLAIWEQFRKTVLFVTHDIDEALLLADRIILMKAQPGRIHDHRPLPAAALDRYRRLARVFAVEAPLPRTTS